MFPFTADHEFILNLEVYPSTRKGADWRIKHPPFPFSLKEKGADIQLWDSSTIKNITILKGLMVM